MNLIEQQNVLRNLPDEALSTAMNSSDMPPYLVLTEINRRKQVREHYLSQKQKYDAAQPSVAAQTVQDFTMADRGMMPPDAMSSGGIDAAAAPMGAGAPAGIDAAAPQGFKNGGAIPGYAVGTGLAGIQMSIPQSSVTGSMLTAPKIPTTARDLSMTPVYTDPYSSLRDYFASQAGEMDKERANAQAMALIAAGLGIAGGKSRNFARNLAGALPALQDYQKQMSDIGQSERQFGLEKAKLEAQSAAEKTAWEQNQPAFKLEQTRKQLVDAGFDPNSEEFKYYLTGITPPAVSSDATPDMKNYRYYVDQEIAAGRVPMQFEEFTKGKPEDALGSAADAEFGKQLVGLWNNASDAQKSLDANATATQLLDSGVITGTGADLKLSFGKALQSAGIKFGDNEIANTEAFIANRAQQVGQLIKMFGAGTGLSDADREYAKQAAAGNIELTEASIRKIIDISNTAASNVISGYNSTVKSLTDAGHRISLPPLGGASFGTTSTDVEWSF